MLLQTVLSLLLLAECTNSAIINKNVIREINLLSQLVKINTTITFYNNNNDDYLNNYTYLIDVPQGLYYIAFYTSDFVQLYHKAIDDDKVGVYFNKKFALYKPIEIHIEELHLHQMTLMYKKRRENDMESCFYKGLVSFYSPYLTLRSNITYTLNRRDDGNDLQLVRRVLVTEDQMPFDKSSYETFNFSCDDYFYSVHKLERTIEIYHFGQIVVEDSVEIANKGAVIVGRKVDFSKRILYTHLPASAENIRMYDNLGMCLNIQHLDAGSYTVVKFTLRHALHGGWKSHYIMKYTLPSYEYLYWYSGNQFILKMRVFDHVLNDVTIDKLITRILLPEFAQSEYLFIPSTFKKLSDEYLNTQLTYSERQTIVIYGENLVENHITDFKLRYSYDIINLFIIPLRISAYCYGIFVLIICTRRYLECCTMNK